MADLELSDGHATMLAIEMSVYPRWPATPTRFLVQGTRDATPHEVPNWRPVCIVAVLSARYRLRRERHHARSQGNVTCPPYPSLLCLAFG